MTYRVAYLVSQYPGLSHTFIEREIQGLRSRGIEVSTFTVRACPPDQLLTATMREEASSTRALLGSPVGDWAKAHLSLLTSAPGAYLKAAVRAARSGDATAKARIWQGFYLTEAVLLNQELKRLGIRHLHVHFANVGADVARLVVALGEAEDGPDAGWRWTMTMHGPTEFENVDKLDLAAKVRSADGVACISDFCRSQLMRMVPPEHWPALEVVRMSVDADRFQPPADNRTDHEGPLRVLYVGRLVPEKGAPVLIEAVAELHRRGIPTDVRIIGAGELREGIEAQLRRHGLDETVTLVGPVGQDEIPGWYHWADVFVLPSFQEGLPVVLMEAMATGLPVITTRIAAVEELVEHGHSGWVLPPGRADLLTEAIAEARDRGDRLARGARGREAVLREFTVQDTSQAMTDFLTGHA